MRCSVTAYLVLAAIFLLGCQQSSQTPDTLDSNEQLETQVFLNINVAVIKDAALKHFGDVQRHGSHTKSELGGPGFMAMNGHKFQRFQIQGIITDDGRKAIYTQLKAEIKSVLNENGATITGEIKSTVMDRPIWYLLMIIPSGSPIDLSHLEGFYLEYTTESGSGFVDVMACRSTNADKDETWEIGLAIHEPHQIK